MRNTIIIISFLLSSILTFSQDKMTNQSILDLLDLGFESEVIIAKINSSQTQFDTSIIQLKALKEKGVTSEVLALMIDKSKVEIESGVFYTKDGKLVKIDPSVFSGTKTSALGAALTGAIASAKM